MACESRVDVRVVGCPDVHGVVVFAQLTLEKQSRLGLHRVQELGVDLGIERRIGSGLLRFCRATASPRRKLSTSCADFGSRIMRTT